MTRQVLTTERAPWSPPHSQGVRVGSTTYVPVAGMNEAYATVFTSEPPTRAVARLGPELPNVRVSITMTAHVDG